MRRQASSTTNTLEVDSVEYAWQLRHGWLVEPGRGLKGVSASVWGEPGVTRELIVDFPFGVFGLDRRPSPARLRGVLPRAFKRLSRRAGSHIRGAKRFGSWRQLPNKQLHPTAAEGAAGFTGRIDERPLG